MTLPRDLSRCAGRFGLGPDDPVCPRREQCARYVDFRARANHRVPEYIPVATGLCRNGDDYLIPIKGE